MECLNNLPNQTPKVLANPEATGEASIYPARVQRERHPRQKEKGQVTKPEVQTQ